VQRQFTLDYDIVSPYPTPTTGLGFRGFMIWTGFHLRGVYHGFRQLGLRIFAEEEEGTLSPVAQISRAQYPGSGNLIVSDMNNDGEAEILICRTISRPHGVGGSTLRVLRLVGTETHEMLTYPASKEADGTEYDGHLYPVDLDGDGRLEVLRVLADRRRYQRLPLPSQDHIVSLDGYGARRPDGRPSVGASFARYLDLGIDEFYQGLRVYPVVRPQTSAIVEDEAVGGQYLWSDVKKGPTRFLFASGYALRTDSTAKAFLYAYRIPQPSSYEGKQVLRPTRFWECPELRGAPELHSLSARVEFWQPIGKELPVYVGVLRKGPFKPVLDRRGPLTPKNPEIVPRSFSLYVFDGKTLRRALTISDPPNGYLCLGDLDEDGLPEIVFKDGEETHVFSQKPVSHQEVLKLFPTR